VAALSAVAVSRSLVAFQMACHRANAASLVGRRRAMSPVARRRVALPFGSASVSGSVARVASAAVTGTGAAR
jgi:hypothetical protein